jgi:drug/metabolite transporter (DMT)-like permease
MKHYMDRLNPSTKNTIYFLLIIVMVAVNNNCFEYLTNEGLHAPVILFYRSVFTLLLTVIYATRHHQLLVPKNIKEQSVRFITTGGSLLLVLSSFNYLSAGTVSLLQRLDIPVLIIFSILLHKKKHWVQILFSVLTVIIVLFLTMDPQFIDEQRNGFLLMFGSIGMVAIGYLTVHKGSHSESVPALINVASVSGLFFGCFIILLHHHSWLISLKDMGIVAISAIVNIMLFYLTTRRYKAYSPEKALTPFVCAIFSTSVLEMIIEQKLYSKQDLFITAALTIIISIICLTNKKAGHIPGIQLNYAGYNKPENN